MMNTWIVAINDKIVRAEALWFAFGASLLFMAGTFGSMAHADDPASRANPHELYSSTARKGIVGIALHVTAERIGEPARLIVRAVHPDGPAAQAGIAHGMEIVSVDGQPVAGKTYQEAVMLIRGEIGSAVLLTVLDRQGDRDVSLTRVSEKLLLEQGGN